MSTKVGMIERGMESLIQEYIQGKGAVRTEWEGWMVGAQMLAFQNL